MTAPTSDVLFHLVPGCEFVVRGEPTNADEYDQQVEWLTDSPKPTWAEVEAARGTVADIENRREIEAARRFDYIREADALFFGFQRGENTEQEWLDKVAEIRARHPYA